MSYYLDLKIVLTHNICSFILIITWFKIRKLIQYVRSNVTLWKSSCPLLTVMHFCKCLSISLLSRSFRYSIPGKFWDQGWVIGVIATSGPDVEGIPLSCIQKKDTEVEKHVLVRFVLVAIIFIEQFFYFYFWQSYVLKVRLRHQKHLLAFSRGKKKVFFPSSKHCKLYILVRVLFILSLKKGSKKKMHDQKKKEKRLFWKQIFKLLLDIYIYLLIGYKWTKFYRLDYPENLDLWTFYF